jgi:hypothetical protein
MGKINYGRVVLGGIVAGIVAMLLDWFSNAILLGQLWANTMKALNRPILLSGPVAFGLFLVEIVGGIAAVWTYAAIRPRFGAGVRTAAYAGLLSWVFVCLPSTANVLQGIFGLHFWLYSTLLASLVSSLISTIIGAALYKEAESTATYPAATPQATR